MLAEMQELFRYNRWANERVLGATSGLTQEEFTRDLRNSFPSVRDTLAHVLGAEWIWLSRWKGVSPRSLPEASAFANHAALRTRWAEVEAEQTAFVTATSADDLKQVITYQNTKGESFSYPLWQLMRHVVNHSTYHRGQVTTMLRQLGAKPISTDLIVFYAAK